MTTPKESRLRKRFTGFLVCAGLLYAGLFTTQGETFVTFAQMVVALYTLYLGGQTATDWKKKALPPG
jgi:hypothetical protein